METKCADCGITFMCKAARVVTLTNGGVCNLCTKNKKEEKRIIMEYFSARRLELNIANII